MIALRKYQPSDVTEAAERLRTSYLPGTSDYCGYLRQLNAFQFRDESMQYWFLDAHLGEWYRFVDGKWEATSAEPSTLEGPADLDVPLVGVDDELPELTLAIEGKAAEDLKPTEVVELIADRLRNDYEEGMLPSTEVEDLMGGQYVVDSQGKVWTVGIRSKQWFYYSDTGWHSSGQPPEVDSLLKMNWQSEEGPEIEGASDTAMAAISQFLYFAMGTIPEPITNVWEPPPDLPENMTHRGITCGSCGANNPLGGKYCTQCGNGLGCPNCGSANPEGSRFCNHCGHQLME